MVIIAVLICMTPVYAQKTIRIHENSDEKVTYSQIFISARLVKLETRPECLIGGKSMVRVDKDRIFLIGRTGIVYIFSSEGRYLSKIDRKGKGPGEMIQPNGFALDRANDQIEIHDFSGRKMVIYDYDGKYIKTHKSAGVMGWEKLSESNYIGYSYNGPFNCDGKQIHSALAVFDTVGKCVKEFQNIGSTLSGNFVVTGSNLYLANDGSAYVVPINQKDLYRVDQLLNIVKVCDFDFDTKTPNMICGLTVINENASLIFFYNRLFYRTFWKLKSNETITVENKKFINDLALVESTGFAGSFVDGVIEQVDAVNFIEIYNNAVKTDKGLKVIQQTGMKDQLTAMVKATSADDNPILIFYTYK